MYSGVRVSVYRKYAFVLRFKLRQINMSFSLSKRCLKNGSRSVTSHLRCSGHLSKIDNEETSELKDTESIFAGWPLVKQIDKKSSDQ